MSFINMFKANKTHRDGQLQKVVTPLISIYLVIKLERVNKLREQLLNIGLCQILALSLKNKIPSKAVTCGSCSY